MILRKQDVGHKYISAGHYLRRDYSVSYLCDPLVDYDKFYLISPTQQHFRALKFLKHLLEYVPPIPMGRPVDKTHINGCTLRL